MRSGWSYSCPLSTPFYLFVQLWHLWHLYITESLASLSSCGVELTVIWLFQLQVALCPAEAGSGRFFYNEAGPLLSSHLQLTSSLQQPYSSSIVLFAPAKVLGWTYSFISNQCIPCNFSYHKCSEGGFLSSFCCMIAHPPPRQLYGSNQSPSQNN